MAIDRKELPGGLLVALLGAACGEPAYYPALDLAVDTGLVAVAQRCGATGAPVEHAVELRNGLDEDVRVVRVDADCVETQLTMLLPFEQRSVLVTDLDGLGAYVTLPGGDVLVAARAPFPGVTSSVWAIP